MERQKNLNLMKPILLHYYITNRCNSRCTFCSIWQETQKNDALEEDVIVNLQKSRSAGCRFVDFTGGEPLLHQNLPLFLREAKNLGFITSVTTNCLLFPETARKLTGLIDLLHFSIDADNPELHDRIRGVPCFDAVLRSIDIAIQLKFSPDLIFTYNDENIGSLDGVYRIARSKKLMLIIDPVFDINGRDKVHILTHMKAMHFSKHKGVYLNRAHLTLRGYGGNHIRTPLCKAVDSTIVLLPDNRMALPCFHHCTSTLPAGNNLNESFSSTERDAARRKQGKYSFCEGCHINCYFDPSYTLMHNRLKLQSILCKISYSWSKYFLYRHRLPRPKLRH